MSINKMLKREVAYLTDLSKKVVSYTDLVTYLNKQVPMDCYFITLTFKDSKYNRYAKQLHGFTFKESDADDIDQVVKHFFDSQRIKYYVRLDLSSENLRFHYHGVIIPHNPYELKMFTVNWNRCFGKMDRVAKIKKLEKCCKYICGIPKEELQDCDRCDLFKFGATKLAMKEWLDAYVLTSFIQHESLDTEPYQINDDF